MYKISPASLPRIVLDHVAAHKDRDLDAFMATLAPDALVNDIQREFLGHAAIRAWAAEEIFGDNVTLQIEAAFQHGQGLILRCRVEGDFDKTNLPDPLILTYYVTVLDRWITQLIIQRVKAAAL